jgi:DNA helicase-2/ATP-dependent DNA helicase PcrA
MKVQIDPEAYKSELGPILLLAGPGTGKTYQLAKRIQYLTSEKGISPDEITVITFTSEAATGMKQKIEEVGSPEYIESEKRPGRISTMHSMGQSILLNQPDAFGLDDKFQVVEDHAIRQTLMNDAALICNLTINEAILALKERITAKITGTFDGIANKYEQILRSCNSIDYDDQIYLACKLLKGNKDLKKKYATKTKYLLVDEYQDINPAQFDLIKILCSEYPAGLFVVGDDDQNIYGFRGGSPDYIRGFQNDFGDKATVLSMNVSRRCLVDILDSAISIVDKFDKKRLDKGGYKYLKTEKGLVVKHDCPSDDREAEIISTIIREKVNTATHAGADAGTFFILVPNRFYVEKIKNTLNHWGISVDFKTTSDLAGFRKIQFLKKWLDNTQSNIPTRYVIELIINSGVVDLPSQKSRLKEKLDQRENGLKRVAVLWNSVIRDGVSLLNALTVASKTDPLCLKILKKLDELNLFYLKRDIPTFLMKLSLYIKPWGSTAAFFEEVEKLLFSNNKVRNNNNNYFARILTFQSAKGLEAETVFIVGLEAENIPKGNDERDIAEQARLLFVAMTRAKEELHLFYCRKRTGSATFRPVSHNLNASPFLSVLPKEKIEEQYHPPKSKLKK